MSGSVKPRHRVIVAAALFHLFSVVAFVWTGLAEGAPGRVAEALRLYRNLSGSFRDYTFFAPAVASDIKAGFLLEDAEGGASFVTFQARGREVGFRYNCIVASCMRDQKGRDLFAQSWAAFVLGSHPQATSVTVMVEAFDLPTMGGYRSGKRPEWKTIYVGKFSRRERRERPAIR